MPTFITLSLPFAIGIIEILVGTSLLLSQPSPFLRAVRRLPVPPDLLATILVLSGVIALVLRIYWPWLPTGVRWAGRILVTLPLLGLGYVSARTGLVAGAVTFLTIAIVELTRRPRERTPRASRPVDSIVLAVFVINILLAVSFIVMPLGAWSQVNRFLLSYRIPLAVLSVVGAATLISSIWIRKTPLRLAALLVGAIPLVAITVGLALAAGWWIGTLHYAVLAAFLVAHPWLHRALVTQERDAATRPDAAAFDRAAEGAGWAVILLLTLAAAVEPSRSGAVSLHLLALDATIVTLIWYRLPPSHTRMRLVWGIALYSGLGAATVAMTGGARSPLFFLYLLPILAASWSLPPKYIALPAGIGLVGVTLDVASVMIREGFTSATIVLAVYRFSGILFVALFAYFLALRARDQRALLRREKQGLEAIVRSLAEGLVVLDQAGAIRVCNPAAERLFNARSAELVGKHLLAALTIQRHDGRPFPGHEHPVLAALERGRPSRQRVLAGTQNGEAQLMALAVSPFSDLGTPGIICTFQDVRSEVEMERMREDFFHIASHEIRTPLTVIKGNAEIALDGSLGELQPGARHVFTEICDATDRLIRLVNDFLDAARVDQGKIRLSIDTANITSLVRQVVDTMGPDARRKGLTLTYLLPDPAAVPLVMMDSEKALQVLLNLVGNAIKYTATGGIEVWHEQGEGIVETHIKDTGVGIAREHRPHLFERFSQAARGLTRQTGGSGLGLYISRTLADRMGGSVYLKESAPGEGSTFVFALALSPRVPRIAVGAASASEE